MTKNVRAYLPYLYIAVIAFLSLAVFSNTTSPFYTEQSMADSGLFQIIGKYWAQGYLPYVDLWDQKGPYTFLCNCIGFMLTGTSTGVFIVQWLCLTLTLFIMLRIFKQGYNTLYSCLLLLIPIASFSANISGGDCVEEFEMPFVAWAYLCVCRWLWHDKEQDIHPASYALVYGIVLGLSLMSRLTNALGLCGAIAVIGIWLISKRQWKKLLNNILAFIVGFAIATLPFIIYFYAKGALYDMWYGTMLYNLDYAEVSTTGSVSLKDFIVRIISYLDTYLLLFSALMTFAFDRHRWLSAVTWTLVSLLSLLWLMTGHGYAHYGVISLPLVAVALVELRTTLIHARCKACSITTICVFLGYVLVTATSCYRAYTLKVYGDKTLAITRSFMKSVPQSYKKSFVCYNAGVGYYLYNDIKPACRFFTFQDWHAANGLSMKNMMQDSYEKAKVEWILADGEPKTIAPMIKREYSIYKTSSDKSLILYKRK